MTTAVRALIIGASMSAPLTELGSTRMNSDNIELWRKVAGRAIYFGHQSVGEDITAGVNRLNKELTLGIRIVLTNEPSAIAHPAFVHFHAGQNLNPASKNKALLDVLGARPYADRAIVMLKYCYVDINKGTDVQAMFAAYRSMVSLIRKRHPDVTIVHATVPLTTVESPLKAEAKRLLGRRSVRDDAIARHKYNALVRAAFAGREPFFDIARLESTREDGTRAAFVLNGEEIEILAVENTHDGGHLNDRGQRLVAGELLNVLARVAGD